ncbi:MAG: hypothetical protein D6681_13650 [Calditrichaeota bacterium]|nr:MAG: hypothetical protein D6681_13650 [Calditrichota bacterium]
MLLSLLIIPAWAQGIADLEREYEAVRQRLVQATAQLDSLNTLLERQTAAIDREKRQPHPDADHIRRRMAESLSLSEEIRRRQKQTEQLQKRLEVLGWQLSRKYAALLDSLQAVEASGKFDGDSRQLREEILRYTERYLLFSPALQALRFDPRKVREIDPAAARDSLERRFAREYLRQALAEVDSHLAQLAENRREVEEALRLEQEAQEFVEEVEGNYLGALGQSFTISEPTENVAVTANRGNDRIGTYSGEAIAIQQQQRMTLFFRQLELMGEPPLSAGEILNDPANLSLSAYGKLLAEAEHRLKRFRQLIEDKLEGKSR